MTTSTRREAPRCHCGAPAEAVTLGAMVREKGVSESAITYTFGLEPRRFRCARGHWYDEGAEPVEPPQGDGRAGSTDGGDL